MTTFIVQYWLEFLFGIFSMGMVAWCGRLHEKLKQRQAEQDALKEGMKAILHDKLFQICNTYLSLGYIPVENSEEILDNAKMIYEAYHGVGGNGTGTAIYERFAKLHIRNPKPM